jgi:regulator of sigma E protease
MVELIHHGWSRQTISGRIEKVGKLLDVRIQLPGGRQEIVHARPAVRSDPELKDYAVLGYRPGTAFQYERVGPITAVDKGIDEARDKATYLVRVLLSMAVQLVEHKMTPAQFGGSFVGPVGIARTSGEFVQAGLPEFLGFLGMLSINLAVLNLLPLPIFDGGNIIIVLLEVLRRKQLEPAQFMAVQLVGLAFIMCLFVYLTYHDIVHLATGTTAP